MSDKMAAARAALAKKREEKKKLGDQNPDKGFSKETENTLPVHDTLSERKHVWVQGMLTAMRNLEVKAAPDVNRCVLIADRLVELYEEKFNG